MDKIVRPLIISLLIISASFSYAQSSQSEYLEAKRQFSLGNFKVAMQSFQGLTNDPVFRQYASFYYALAAYKLEQYQVALDMWKQIKAKFPKWDKNGEVDYWIADTYFKQGKLWDAFKKVEELPENWKDYLIEAALSKVSLEGLDSAYALNRKNAYIAKYYAKAIKRQPYDEQDRLMLEELSEKFDLGTNEKSDLPLIKKDSFAIAVVLPFMFEAIDKPQTVTRNAIIFDLYQGMKFAQRDLKENGIHLNLFPFDTKKKGAVTYDLIKSGKLDDADLIIGPLYGGPNKYISQFSQENKITMINPLSSNGEIIGDNPYAYLFRPSYSTQGRKAAEFAAKKYTKNKKLFIFYETDRDSIVANAYLKRIEKDSFFVIRFDRLTDEDALQIQRDFTEEYDIRLDTMYTQREIDSIASIPGRIVRTRSLRNEATGRIIKDKNGEDVIESYEVKFTIQPDSIGHIFAATSSNLLANNFISMVEVRSDSIGIIGYNDWLDFSLVSYPQLERLQINFLSPSYYDSESESFKSFETTFIEEFGAKPSSYHVYGYELIQHLGKLMKSDGKYFQRGLMDATLEEGQLMEGMKYGPYNDNQLVPITTLRDLILERQN